MKNISILGSTGSIGTQTLIIVRNNPELFRVRGLAANKNIDLISKQIDEFKPDYACLSDDEMNNALKDRYKHSKTVILDSIDRNEIIASLTIIDSVVMAVVGISGLKPTIEAIKSGKIVALANKETMVTGGELINKLLKEHKGKIIPVDSEHSAIWQCMKSGKKTDIDKILLTSSGGPFRTKSYDELLKATASDALRHPTWNMGNKVTIDSATLMNKGLEVIEAMRLFKVKADKIQVVIQPQSIIHSMVSFLDGSVMANLYNPSMVIPIQYALTYPRKIDSGVKPVDFCSLGKIDFYEPDLKKFPCLQIAYDCAKKGGNRPVALNAADEIIVNAFLSNKIRFMDIPYYISKTLDNIKFNNIYGIDDIVQNDYEARKIASNYIDGDKK